ncbi:Uma2 family endonuclease [Streptomyces sp. NPDC091682]|uniref:Uma2 family endonuclease n=1 Tax=Streptomyces sp. NPDC091682 TaxID=3366005 RepID=UPI0037FEA0E1
MLGHQQGGSFEDLDRLPEAPRHTELIDGALVFMLSPQRSWHGRLVTALTTTLMAQAPDGFEVEREMTIRLDARNRLEPDLLLTNLAYDPDRTWYDLEDVKLVVETVSPESAHRDRTVKLRKYAEAGTPHYWCIEDEGGAPVVHAPAGIFQRPVPFEISTDLDKLTPPRSS